MEKNTLLLIKIGGGADINWDYIADDLASMNEPYILVHGANSTMTQISQSLQKEERTIQSPSGFSSRYSDKETIDVFLQAYCGLANKRLVELLQRKGIKAVGLSGIDGGIWTGKKKAKIIGTPSDEQKVRVIRDNYVGNVTQINTELLTLLLSHDYVPVLTAPAISLGGEIINVDNDRAVATMVKELNIKEVVMLFGAPGLLRDHLDETSVIPHLTVNELEQSMEFAKGRMKKKVLGTQEAFKNGLETMYWGDGRIKNPISSTRAGIGTQITQS
ncbi:[LysW]-aminoadipate kinase [Candidatus Dojkabacteria bacterium]|uniref:[LysW]-aminoadipate kinase n=1 Tax=Candidatus Dojkabacteria bacterium TaxID=2099670 RepID=A0A955L765_9BACT|nr:[LysW]-aminoadipate kinase [Candidatus Dojkabacteria bacterium]